MKNLIKEFCIWFLTKYNPCTIEEMRIDSDSITISLKGFIRNDKKWHHNAFTLEYWVKSDTKNPLYELVQAYRDGELKAEYRFGNPVPKLKRVKKK